MCQRMKMIDLLVGNGRAAATGLFGTVRELAAVVFDVIVRVLDRLLVAPEPPVVLPKPSALTIKQFT
jgi:hypothetical protein